MYRPTYLNVIEDLRALGPVELGRDDDGDVVVAARGKVEAHAGEVAARLAHRARDDAVEESAGEEDGRRGRLQPLHRGDDSFSLTPDTCCRCHFRPSSLSVDLGVLV